MAAKGRLPDLRTRRIFLTRIVLLAIQLAAIDVGAQTTQSDATPGNEAGTAAVTCPNCAPSSSPGKTLVTTATGEKAQPLGTAIDSGNNLIVANHTAGTVSKYNSSGVLQWTTTGAIPTELIAIDQWDNIWTGEYQSARITEISDATGAVIGTGSTGAAGKYPGPLGMAFDALGNLWMTVHDNYPSGSNRLVEMNQIRTVVAPSPFASSYIGGSNLAIDSQGFIWIPGYGSSNTLTKFSSAGLPVLPIPLPNGPSSTFTLTSGSAVISGSTNLVNNQAVQLSTTGSLVGTGFSTETTYYAVNVGSATFGLSATAGGTAIVATGTGTGTPSVFGTFAQADRAVVDSEGNVWVAFTYYCEVVKYSPTGTLLATASVDTGGKPGQLSSNSLAIDGANNLWVAGRRNAAVWEVSPAGTVYGPWAVPGKGGAITSSVDRQGNDWASSGAGDSVTKVQGIGAGVQTPLVANLSQTPSTAAPNSSTIQTPDGKSTTVGESATQDDPGK
jgi:hypothetical protein